MLYVTGVTGHSGKWFLKRLMDEGYSEKIRCVMRDFRENSPEKYTIFENCNLNIEFAIGDLDDVNFLEESIQGVDIIVHIAGIRLSEKIITAAITNNVHWAIFVHTTGRFSNFKSASEDYIKIEDLVLSNRKYLAITVIRPTMIYGSSQDKNMYRLIEYLSKYLIFPLFGDGSNLMQPVHAKDLGNAYYEILVHPERTMNKEYNLSGKDPMTYLEIVKVIRNSLNSKIIIIKIPVSLSILAAKLYNFLFKNAVITVEQVMRMQENKDFSHEDAITDFGYNPISFEEGVQEEIREFKSGMRVDYSKIKY